MGALRFGARADRQSGAVVVLCLAVHSLLALADPGPRDIAWRTCFDSSVVVASAVGADADDACQGARRAVDFFRKLDLRADEPIVIEILQELPDVVSQTAAGAFLKSERRVLLQTYEHFKVNQTWFEIPVDRRLYQSTAAHEVAHALASSNFRIPKPSLVAMEYIAYVTQFATMDESQRNKALAAIPGDGFDNELEMSEVIYMLAPMQFAAKAYRHYLRPENGPAYLRTVLSGAVLAD